MSDVRHTPGPWSVHYDYGTTQIRTSDNTAIMCDETYYPWVPENIADWHLIAAAPELLENAEKWVDLVQRIFNETAIPVSANIAMDLQQGLDETKALTAKAKGDV